MAISKLPYEVDSEIADGAFGHQRYYKLLDADGKSIMDTLNSEVACIHTDDDGDSGGQWDEQGRVDMEFVATAANLHAEMVAALNRVMFVADQLPNTLHDVRKIVAPLLEKAGSFHQSVESFHKERDSLRTELEECRTYHVPRIAELERLLTEAQGRIGDLCVVVGNIEQCRCVEGDCITILCDDPDCDSDERAAAVEVSGDYTGYEPQRFYGRNWSEALAKAAACSRNHYSDGDEHQ